MASILCDLQMIEELIEWTRISLNGQESHLGLGPCLNMADYTSHFKNLSCDSDNCTYQCPSNMLLSPIWCPACKATVSRMRGPASLQVSFRSVEDIEEELRARRQYAKDHGAQAYESSDDEDGGRGNQRVQCAQQ